MSKLGSFIRSKREEYNLLLRHLAAKLDVDVAYLSKLERGERSVRLEHVVALSEIFNVPSGELKVLWLSDQITELLASILDDSMALKALNLSKKELSTLTH